MKNLYSNSHQLKSSILLQKNVAKNRKCHSDVGNQSPITYASPGFYVLGTKHCTEISFRD